MTSPAPMPRRTRIRATPAQAASSIWLSIAAPSRRSAVLDGECSAAAHGSAASVSARPAASAEPIRRRLAAVGHHPLAGAFEDAPHLLPTDLSVESLADVSDAD